MKINIAGDFNLENRVSIQIDKGISILEDDFAKFWFSTDYRIANLESPITRSKNHIRKVGRHIKGELTNHHNLKQLGVNYFSLANNHIMDFGIEGLHETIENLNTAEIGYFGIISNNKKYRYKILEKNDLKIAIGSFSNKEFSLHSDFNGNGAIAIDVIEITELLQELKSQVNHIVLILHTGFSRNPLPSPNLREMCRYLIRQGAALVLCQHSHTIGAFEYYNNGFISYGQGHFAFDLYRENSDWNLGYTVKANFRKSSFEVDVVGHKQFDNNTTIRLLTKNEQELFNNNLSRYNTILLDDDLFKQYYSDYVYKHSKTYFSELFLPKNKLFRKILRLLPYDRLISNESKMKLLNYLRNEEHNEIMQHLINIKLQK
ncbi:MAG: CapA family protein [Bacteroidales bacterium]|jgi:poly-gamma-glutamate synthesis protein (capsule biosynthesis protein)|nr:CapA family protein [Bacteroidales bacterium]MDX9795640.1 CapA family protein [Arcobacteraceae bacterium]